VADGVVTLAGRVISLSHKRLAGVLAWWVPGCRDVVNRLEVAPPEQDNDDEIGDALRLALEKDPLVHADQIRVSVRNRVVTLEGYVVTKEEMKMAEWDAWYLFGVEEVVNNIEVQK
jgi:osmotically-inducible protein OsmY